MTEVATLRKLRATNSKLMKSNLALLTAIREIDCEIEDDWRALQQCCTQLEANGLAIPSTCLALMGAADKSTAPPEDNGQEPVEHKRQGDNTTPEETADEHERGGKRPKVSVLSVQSVLNAEPSEEENDNDDNDDDNDSHETGDSASDQGSVEQQ